MEYNHYQLNDFLHDDTFVAWTLQQAGHPQWQQFYEHYPEKRLLMQQAQTMIRAINQLEATQPEVLLNKQKIWQAIQSETGTTTGLNPARRRHARRFGSYQLLQVGLLLCMLVGVAVSLWLWHGPKHTITYDDLLSKARQKARFVEVANSSDEPRLVILEDGSRITLKKGSQLSYPVHFAVGKREVVLSGEAFFEVSKDPKRPFYVYANELVTKVLGTSFRVSAFAGEKQVIVQVRSGKVSVFKQNRIDFDDPETQGLVLLPNQQAVLNRESEGLNRQLVETPLPVKAEPKTFRIKFEDASAVTVLRELGRLYEVEIRFNEDVLSECYITTTINGESLYNQLDVICQTLGASYKIIDAQIIIESTGCR